MALATRKERRTARDRRAAHPGGRDGDDVVDGNACTPHSHDSHVAVPILSWIGIGNVMSVVLPVAAEPLICRWRQRRQLRITIAWVASLALPYALFYVADPIDGLPHKFLWREVPAAIGPILGHHSRSFVHIGIALAVWVGGTVVAQLVVSRRGLRTLSAR